MKEAIPPTDYEAAYSQIPGNTTQTWNDVKYKIRKAYIKLMKDKQSKITRPANKSIPKL